MVSKNEVAAQIMEHLCKHDSHGYTQGNSWGYSGEETIRIDGKSYTIATGYRDCSSAVIYAYQAAGTYCKVGDQTGKESLVRRYYSYPCDGILHYTGGNTNPSVNIYYRVSTDPDGKSWYSEMKNHLDQGGSRDNYAGNGKAIDGFRARLV